MKVDRRSFLEMAGAAGVARLGSGAGRSTANPQSGGQAAAPGAAQPAAPEAPNILIFMPDQQNGATVLPGSPVHKPNLDRFLREGVAFTAAHCPAPHCCPSRASFLSGLYPSEHGVFNNVTTDTAIHPNPYPGTPFWGRSLRAAGYQMGYAGKLHVGRDIKAEDCGFDTLSALEQDSLAANERAKSRLWHEARQQSADPVRRSPGEYLRPGWTNGQLYKTLPDESFETSPDYRIVQAGIAGMRKFAQTRRPWCLMISNSGAHDPYNAPKRFVDLYDPEEVHLPASFADMLDDKPRIYQRQRFQYWSQLSDLETRDAIRHYRAKCSMQDELFGQMLRALDETGQAENTIVVYVSDHGDYMGAHGLWFKGVPSFQEAYHVPAVVRWPRGVRSPGRQVDAFVDQVDFGPTFLEAAGVPADKPLSGSSLLPFLRGQPPPAWRSAFHSQMNGVELYYTQRIVATKDWKYVYNGFDYDELYDLRNDPHEMSNLAFPNLGPRRAAVQQGRGLTPQGTVPWPAMPPRLDGVRKDLLSEMWSFAAAHHDFIFNPYGTVAMAPYGPGLGPDPNGAA